MAEENNIGASRLLGTNGLQQAVDSLTTQVSRLSTDVGRASTSFGNVAGSINRSSATPGSSNMGNLWNSGSNRANYGSNGGGSSFTGFAGGGMGGGRANGGGGGFGSTGPGSRLSFGVAAGASVLSGLTQYANKNMSTNMQMDFYGTQSAIAGGFSGGYRGAAEKARDLAFNNNYAALNATDAARGAYINQYTFGNSQFNGKSNPAFVSGMTQANSFGYASPTLGATGAATAAQQTFSARATMVAPALGLASPILQGGVKNSMGNIAQSIYQRTFGSQKVNNKQFNAAISQGGSLAVNLQYFGQALGWNQQTTQEYQNYLQGQVAAQNKGMSATQYASLSQQAAQGNKSAINTLAKTTGMGSSMFENQRDLNATKLTRQNDILDSLAPAFDNATKAVNKFSGALTMVLKNTGLDKLIGTGAGTAAPFSNAVGGFGSAFGAVGGIATASRLFGGPGGFLGGLFGGAGRAGTAGAAANMGTTAASAGANGAYNITSLGTSAATGSAAAGGLGGVAKFATVAGPIILSMGHSGSGLQTDADNGIKKHGISITQSTALWRQWVKDNPKASNKQISEMDKRMDKEWKKGTLAQDPALSKYFGSPASDGQSGGASNASSGGGGGGGSYKASGTNGGANAASVIKFAEEQLGDPYVWGGTGPNGWDCSGLTQWAFGQAGVKIPRVASDQQKQGKAVPTDAVQPGDLLFNGNPAHHVVMSIGGGKIIEAPHTGANVRIRSFSPGEFTNARRILGSVGDMGSLINGQGGTPNTLNDQQSTSGGDIGGGYGGTSELSAIMGALSGTSAGGPVPLSASSGSAGSVAGAQSPTANVTGTGSNKTSSLQAYAKKLLASYGWSGQWASFNALEMSEAGWNPKATNPSSGAYGLPQALPKGKMASAGADYATNGETQLRWMMGYIKDRYKDPNNAWSFHQRNNWYDQGAWSIDKDQPATVHKGEMIIPAEQAETIRQTLINNTFNPNAGKGGGGSVSFGDIYVNLPSGYTGSAQEAKTTGKMIVDTMREEMRLKNIQIGQ